MAKEGKVLEQKKLMQPLLGTPEGTEMGCSIFFTSSTLTVYSSDDPLITVDQVYCGEKIHLAQICVRK